LLAISVLKNQKQALTRLFLQPGLFFLWLRMIKQSSREHSDYNYKSDNINNNVIHNKFTGFL